MSLLCRSSGSPTCPANSRAGLTWQFWNGEQWVASTASVSCNKHCHGASQAEQLLQLVKDLKIQPKVAVVPATDVTKNKNADSEGTRFKFIFYNLFHKITSNILEIVRTTEKKIKIAQKQKLRGTRVFLEPGEIVTELTPDEDGWITVRTEDGEEGEIPVTCISKGIVIDFL